MHVVTRYMLLGLYIRTNMVTHREIAEFITAQDMVRLEACVESLMGPYAADRRLVFE